MLDNELIKLIISTIIAQETAAGIPNTPIKQAFQPTNQGVNKAPTAYLYKVSDQVYGYPYRSDVWDEDNQKMIHTELQQYITTFQISTLSTQDPNDTEQYTASDILNFIRYTLQSSKTVASFSENGIGILRVMAVRNIPFIDDRDRHEYMPSFDFSITHKQIVTTEIDVLQSVELAIYQI